ncbi:MAG: C69 family dipeptidase [Ignavibacteria bacterium]|jgi:dipeptidase|nr:C69 family dipeptidase [Ignavibacteria bacterium]
MRKLQLLIAIIFIAATTHYYLYPCTNLLVTKGASTDGSAYVTYNADAGGFMEPLYYHAGGPHNPNDSMDILEWDSGWLKFLGKIPQVAQTYRVVGNMNEYQVSIGETTFGGREELEDSTGQIDYGNLMYIALQRAKTAREAIKVMTDLVAQYGYYSEGESISICDPNEAWILEIIGKGAFEKGAVWVAKRIPDGYISAHANKSRINELIEDKPDECLYSPDVVSFAIKHGFYDPAKGKPFSFADAYDPATPSGLFACEGRVWSMFNRAAPSLNLKPDYFRGVIGAEPYPLYIKPDKPLSLSDVMALFRDHFEGTEFDMTKGIVAGPYGLPYRWKGLYFKLDGDTATEYCWERPISTQQTAFSFIAQMRSNMPREIGGCFWYGVDDNYLSVYTPLYTTLTDVPEHYRSADVAKLDLNSAEWIFNLVANTAYRMYSVISPDIIAEQKLLESNYITQQAPIEQAALAIYKENKPLALEFLANYSKTQAQNTYEKWYALWEKLTVKYNDGYKNDVRKNAGRSPGSVGYGDAVYRQVVKERPGYYEMKWKNPKKK